MPRGTYPTTAANTIEIRIEKIAQLFHSLDPFPYHEKDLDNDVEQFIVGWARELPPDKPLRIIVHLPETEASTPETHELGAAFAQYFAIVPESSGSILTSCFASAGERWPLVSRYSPSPSSLAKQSSTLRRVRSVVSLKRACLFSDGSRIGRQSKYSFMIGGRSFDGATCINDFRRRM
jgi:hypothetical protein